MALRHAVYRGVQVQLVLPIRHDHPIVLWAGRSFYAELLQAGVDIETDKALIAFEPGVVRLECVYSEAESSLEADCLVPVTSRMPNDGLWHALLARRDDFEARGGLSLQRIGDCRAPGIFAAAVYAGHMAARELGAAEIMVKRDRVVV